MMLRLALKTEYFEAILRGEKTVEYRCVTPYWSKRLEGRTFDGLVLTRGYPSRHDLTRRLELPWRGLTRQTITHPHFGPAPIEVFAIRLA